MGYDPLTSSPFLSSSLMTSSTLPSGSIRVQYCCNKSFCSTSPPTQNLIPPACFGLVGLQNRSHKYFSFLYAPELKPSTFPKEKVEMALGAHNDGEKKSDMVSWHLFITNYHLWQAINIKPDRRAI